MGQREKPKWQKEVEEILRKQFPEPEVSVMIGIANKLNDLADEVEVPSGDTGEVAALMMKSASRELRPLAAVYLGFQLGAAYERLQNVGRTGKKQPKPLKRVELETKDGTLDWAKICPGKQVPTFFEVYPAKLSKKGRPIGKATKVIVWIDEDEDDDANSA